ncbi:calcium-binding protein [Pseudomonas sp. NA-150]|uniref:calcium-binding protein n=1 Tax=Pseudomonas sp. NA-150 TaxID=3367525 RepID=UPI0037C5F945
MQTFKFPIRKADGSEFKDAEQLHTALEAETSGFYLLGKNRFWHGGVHISDQSAPQCVYDEPVRCIADGEVVAYRLNRDYLESQVGDVQMKYSTSFCLVRHTYESPPNPDEGPNQDQKNSLTFYSLYMHLLPFERYPDANPNHIRRVKVINGGWPARNVPKGREGSTKLGNIENGTEFDILEEIDNRDDYHFARGRIVKGQIGQLREGAEVWFASRYRNDRIRAANGHARMSEVPAPQREWPTYWRGQVLAHVRDELELFEAPASGRVGARLPGRNLGPNSLIRYDEGTTVRVTGIDGETWRMAECTSDGRLFWARVEDDVLRFAHREINCPLSAIAPAEPIPIRAGDPIGYLGLYEMPVDDGKTSKHQVHLEVFTFDPNLDAFLDNEAGLKQGKQFLEVRRLQQHILMRDVQSEFTNYLFQDQIYALNKVPTEHDEAGVESYKITVEARDRSGQRKLRTLTGLINKERVNEEGSGVRIVSQHDLRAIGFKVVEQYVTNSCSPLPADRLCNFYGELHAIADRDGDGTVTPAELQKTLRNPAIRDRWSKVIPYHHTEWQLPSSDAKWQPLRDRLVSEPERLRYANECIDNLVFWDQLPERVGLPRDGMAWYFHPVEFLSSLMTPRNCCDAKIKVTRWRSRSTRNTYYGPVHWGDRKLGEESQWEELLTLGIVTDYEKEIIVVMTENEGKLNAVQSYDSEILTAGAMQKTISPSGQGEFPLQVKKFKDANPDAYFDFFESQGWFLDTSENRTSMYYQYSEWCEGAKLEGAALKESLRVGCSDLTLNSIINCLPISSMVCAISSPLYVRLQIMDYIDRLRSALRKKPSGYGFSAAQLFRSKLGQALVLDQDINRPGNVRDDLGAALDSFYKANPEVSKQVEAWGDLHAIYENSVIEIYGRNRRMTEPVERLEKLQREL